MNKEYLIKNENELHEIAGKIIFYKEKNSALIVLLFGDLGVGKTTLTKKIGKIIGVENISSPSFSILNEYHDSKTPLFHFDLYRLNSKEDFYSSFDINEYIRKKGIIVIEWPEKITDDLILLTAKKVKVTLAYTETEQQREIKISEI